jgi:hypothetical protein
LIVLFLLLEESRVELASGLVRVDGLVSFWDWSWMGDVSGGCCVEVSGEGGMKTGAGLDG